MGAPGRPLVQVPADYLTYEEAAKALGLQPTSLRAAISAGKLHPLKVQGLGRKFISRAEVDSYHARKGNRGFEREPAPANTFETADAARLRELAAALSGPTIEALREAQVTAREAQVTAQHAMSGLVQIAVGVALGASGMATQGLAQGLTQGLTQGLMTSPK